MKIKFSKSWFFCPQAEEQLEEEAAQTKRLTKLRQQSDEYAKQLEEELETLKVS